MIRYPKIAKLLQDKLLGISQKELSYLCGVSQPTISYWINGQKRPAAIFLAKLIDVYKIDIYAAAEASGYSISELIRLCTPYTDHHIRDILELTTDIRRHISTLRKQGVPHIALAQCDMMIVRLMRLRGLDLLNYGRQVNRAIAILLATKVRILSESLSKENALHPMMQVVNDLRKLSDINSDEEISALFYTSEGCISYIYGRNNRSLELNLNAIDLLMDIEWKIEVSRAIAISSGEVNSHRHIKKAKNVILRLVNDNVIEYDQRVFLLEGLGRGQVMLGIEEGLENLNQAQSMLSNGFDTVEPLRQIQISRSRLKAHKSGLITLTDVEELGLSILSLSHRYHYDRYNYEINKLLGGLLN